MLVAIVVYVNTGQEMDMDSFSVDVSDGIHKVPTTFRIMIKSIDDEPPIMVGMKPGLLEIDLEVYESQTVTISENKLKATDPDTDDMVLTFMIERQPNEGGIYVRGRRTDHFSQENIVRGEVAYHHQGGDVGINGRNDSFTLVLTDMSRNFMVGGNEINRILVNINILPVDNIPPRIILGAPFEVAESGKEAILPRHLDAVDDDSYDENLQCLITLQPSYGYIENIAPLPGSEKSRVGFPIAAFYINDVRMGYINYVQSVHEGFEHRRDIFRIKCTDGINMNPEEIFNVEIYPSNDETPKVYIREFVVMEGMELRIDTPILKATDSDIPPDVLQFIITKQPRHGQILQQRNVAGTFPVSNFTMFDISRSSTIMYKHDDTETTQDFFEFILTDGIHNVTKAIPIMIIPVDDETPRLTINNGLQVESVGEKTLITNMELKAQDLDSPDPNITFIIRRIPRHGYMLKMEGNQVFNLSNGMNFTQFDIDNRRIYYVHTGLEGRRDLIKFDVTDGLNPLIDRYFYVTIAGIDTIYPEVINRGVKLPEGGTVVLTTDILSGTDLNTPDENLRFVITKAPDHGYLTSTDLPGVPITTFTQLDLAGNKIRYRHTSESEMKMDRFEFEVTDGFNPVSRTFRIAITDVDNKRPVLMFSTLHVKEGGNKLITPFELKALDRDTPDDKLTFTVTQVPLHGNILHNFSRIVDIFTNLDLEENLISYQHDGTDTLKDSFSFTITDGTHNEFFILSDTNSPTRQPQMMQIEIIPVDNGIPQISINRGVTSLSALPGKGLGVKITNKILRTDDRDSPVDKLKYVLTSPPKNGYIINSDHGNQSINSWTQGDIDAMKIFYILMPHVNATNDDFFFKITDKGGNELANQPFHLNWCWISFTSDQYFVNETDELLEINYYCHRQNCENWTRY
ncbi:hypothetical protein KUTeg_024754 [Tegillarca granosa]|uniref:FRAS1-related extracellular matrix protein 2 n=1 Tax=Tegillarca granosa TaxID=220873 RepID=A0ABQ9DY91_TEGGR|nr:hypothetical protein KUTeg_024754 [Tegillarca granosa]